MKSKEELLKSKHFCILPFVHACVWTNGRAIPCCINQRYELGNTRIESLHDIYSPKNEKLKALQKQMLTGPNLPPSCDRCSIPEESYDANSYRYFSNRQYGHLLDKLEFDSNDNLVENKIALWDVRFSNLCNLKCRTCDSTNSSKIAEEERKQTKIDISVLQKAFTDKSDFFEFFLKNLDNIEEIYFCGGESLLLDEHYEMLDILIANKKFDTILRYNTNCTKLTFKDKNVVDDYWPLFKNLRLSISLDAGWEQLELIRHGSVWDTVYSNLKHIRTTLPDAYIQLCPTIGILNAFNFSKVHLFLAREKIIYVNDVYYNILNFPEMYSITALPITVKDQIRDHWKEYETALIELGCYPNLLIETQKVIKYMYSEDNQMHLQQFVDDSNNKDQYRKENTISIFPELREIIK